MSAIREADLSAVSPEDVAAWVTYATLMNEESPPTVLDIDRLAINVLPDFITPRLFVCRDADGSVAGDVALLTTHTENSRHVAQLHLGVRPDRRRRGLARALLGTAVRAAHDDGQTLLIGVSSDRVPSGAAFAAHLGATAAQQLDVNRLRIADVDWSLVRGWIADGPRRAPDYRLLAIDGAYPEDLFEQIMDLRRVMETAPRDALERDMPLLTTEQMRGMEQQQARHGTQRWSLFARHEPTGELAAFTEVCYRPMVPGSVQQMSTATRPAQRGRGLARWMKAVMLERIARERPDVDHIRTGNATSNAAMIAINRDLGFTRWIVATTWQMKTADACERLSV